MVRFGPRVIARAAQMIEDVTGTFTLIGNYLDACGVPSSVQTDAGYSYGGRLGHLGRVLQYLDENQPDRVTTVLEELISGLNSRQRHERIEQLDEALRERGFSIDEDGKVRPLDILVEEVQEVSDYLDDLISRNQEYLTTAVIKHHLKQHRDLYSEGAAPSPATSEARQVIEQILKDIAKAVASDNAENPDLDRPYKVRNYLTTAGFFDEDEKNRLVIGIYGFLSEVGSHPGVADSSMGRMAHVVLLNFAVYLLEKLQRTRGE